MEGPNKIEGPLPKGGVRMLAAGPLRTHGATHCEVKTIDIDYDLDFLVFP